MYGSVISLGVTLGDILQSVMNNYEYSKENERYDSNDLPESVVVGEVMGYASTGLFLLILGLFITWPDPWSITTVCLHVTICGLKYYTGRMSYYEVPSNFIHFHQFLTVPKRMSA